MFPGRTNPNFQWQWIDVVLISVVFLVFFLEILICLELRITDDKLTLSFFTKLTAAVLNGQPIIFRSLESLKGKCPKHGRRLRETVPHKFEVGAVHASVNPIFWEVVLSNACESTYWAKKRYHQGGFKKSRFFSWRKGHIWLDVSYIAFPHTVKTGKIWKIWSMTKKRSSAILGVKMENISEVFLCEIFPSPQTLRQVSAYGPTLRMSKGPRIGCYATAHNWSFHKTSRLINNLNVQIETTWTH